MRYIEIKNLDGVKAFVDEKLYIRASKRALKESVRWLKKEIVKDVRARYNIKASVLKAKMKEKYGYVGSRYAWRLDVQGRPMSLTHFGAKQTKKGVTVKIKKNIGRKLIRHAFIAKNQVFIRETKRRLPIKALKTLSVPQMFRPEIIDRRVEEANEKYQKRFYHHLQYLSGGR